MIPIERELSAYPNLKTVTVKLGGDCNLNCPHCHCQVGEYQYNPDILRWIKLQRGVREIRFGGGEPLLYWDTIRKIVTSLGESYRYRFVTNGTLLTDEIVEFCNEYEITVCFSFDGVESKRDQSIQPRWDLAGDLLNFAFSPYNTSTNNVVELGKQIDILIEQYHIQGARNYSDGNILLGFVHEKAGADCKKTQADVDEYLKWMKANIERKYAEVASQNATFATIRYLHRLDETFYSPAKISTGVRCANDRSMVVTLDGRFMGCAYNDQYFGNIYMGFDFPALESLIPEKCKRCPAIEFCQAFCFVNETNHQCRVVNVLHKFIGQMKEKYGDLPYRRNL